MEASGAEVKVKKGTSVPERSRTWAGAWLKTQLHQCECDEEEDARSECFGAMAPTLSGVFLFLCVTSVSASSSFCVSVFP